MTVTAERETCRLHPDGCRDGDRHPLPVKGRTDIKREMKAKVEGGSAQTVSSFGEEAIEARVGVVRCVTCHEAVPLIPGDLTGHPLDWWISEAVRTVSGQRHRDHAPVPLGAIKTVPRARSGGAVPAVSPLVAPGSVKFQPPGGSPVTTEVPDRKKRRG